MNPLNNVLNNLLNQPINIVEEVWHYLSPFSAHEIEINGEIFKTAEHAYQCLKLKVSTERENIKNAKSPLQAWLIAQEYKNNSEIQMAYSREKLEEIMEEIFRAKVNQHAEIKEILKLSHGRGILKVFGRDENWGTGIDGSGANTIGKIWMKIREEL